MTRTVKVGDNVYVTFSGTAQKTKYKVFHACEKDALVLLAGVRDGHDGNEYTCVCKQRVQFNGRKDLWWFGKAVVVPAWGIEDIKETIANG